MKLSRQQIIAFSCVLLLQLGLFASAVHAEEHPFHAKNELCASFINFSHHDISFDAAPAIAESVAYVVVALTEISPQAHSTFRSVYTPRAPPVSSL